MLYLYKNSFAVGGKACQSPQWCYYLSHEYTSSYNRIHWLALVENAKEKRRAGLTINHIPFFTFHSSLNLYASINCI